MDPRSFSYICLTGLQRDQSLVAVSGDSDNSLSMRWVKSGSTGAMNHAAGAGGGLHWVTTSCGGVEVERALLAVAEELVLQGEPDGAGSGSGMVVPNNLLEIGRDCAEEPRHDDAVHALPVGVGVVGGVGENMAPEGEFPKNQEHLVAPAGVVVGLHVEDGGDESVG